MVNGVAKDGAAAPLVVAAVEEEAGAVAEVEEAHFVEALEEEVVLQCFHEITVHFCRVHYLGLSNRTYLKITYATK